MADPLSKITEIALSVAFEQTKKHAEKKIDEKELKKSLQDFFVRQKKYHDICQFSEEFDFQGFVEYIDQNLMPVIQERVFCLNQKKRREAHDRIINEAVSFSHAETQESIGRVRHMISICLELIRDFYKSKNSLKDFELGIEIVDSVSEEIEQAKREIIEEIKGGNNILVPTEFHQTSFYSIDKALNMAKQDPESIETGIKAILDAVSTQHPLYPCYGYDYKNGKTYSRALTDSALKKYPPRLVITGTLSDGLRVFDDPCQNPLDYSYRHQRPIMMEISKAKKYLGNIEDPLQTEVEDLVNNTVSIIPPQFPPAFPCAIIVNEEHFYEYILFRTKEIEDDGTICIDNSEQEGTAHFVLRINPKLHNHLDMAVHLTNATNHESLSELKFIKSLSSGGIIHIYVYEEKEDLIAGRIDKNDYESSGASLNDNIEFLERVCEIEDTFHIRFNIESGDVEEEEYSIIYYISELIRHGQLTRTWAELTIEFEINHLFLETNLMKNTQYTFSYVLTRQVDLWGAVFEFQTKEIYNSAKIKDFEHMMRKVEVLEDGDKLKVQLCPGDDNTHQELLLK